MDSEDQESEYMTVGEARELLGATKPAMARLIREGELKTVADPFNRRVKLIKRSDVEVLRARPRHTKKALARVA